MTPRSDLHDRAGGSITIAIALGAFLIATLAVIASTTGSKPLQVDTVSAGAGLPQTANLVLNEYTIAPSKLTTKEGLVTLHVTNSGTLAHNISIPALGKKTLDLGPGASADLALGDVPAGTYPLLCEIAGHADSGMKGTLIVGSGKGSGSAAAAGTDQAAGAGAGAVSEPPMNNAQMEKDMTAGVTTFLDFAKRYAAGKVKTGNAKLAPKVLPDGTKEFDLTAAITDWEVSPGKIVKAWSYNGIVPGPWIKVDPGDKVRVVIHNKLPISTDVHLHGVDVPFEQDGLAPITQSYIKPGTSYTYAFTAAQTPKLGMYHAHMDGQVAIVNGLFAVFQVGEVALPAGKSINGIDVPTNLDRSAMQEIPIVVNDAGVIGMSINGKAFPETAPLAAKKGEWLLLDFFNEGLQGHPMHLHRQPQLVVAKDGYPLTSPYRMDTLWVAPGERYTVLVHAEDVGTWALHCHIVSHAENDKGLYGMVTALIVS